MKKCKTCLLTKPDDQYTRCSIYKDKVYYRGDCKDCHNAYNRSEAGKLAQKKHRSKEDVKERRRIYKRSAKYRKTERAYEAKRRKEDPLYVLRRRVRDRTRLALRCKNFRKKNHLNEYLGCTIPELKEHLIKQFTPDMTLEALMQGKIHIDHIIPLDSAKTAEEIYLLCHFTNLQPLWAVDNMKKSNKPQ